VNYLQTLLSDAFVVLWLLLVGLFFILVVLFWPGGIVGLARHESLRAWLRKRGLVA
jgi:ABC-type branched-subunit amino acid transport system permease subunit